MGKLRSLKRKAEANEKTTDYVGLTARRVYRMLTPDEWDQYMATADDLRAGRLSALQADIMTRLLEVTSIRKVLQRMWIDSGATPYVIALMSTPQWWRRQVKKND